MKKIVTALLAALLLFCAAACTDAPAKPEDGTFRVTATFYPIWVMAANVVDGVDGVELTLLAPPQTGCLHNYQLLPKDMRTLSDTDLLLINGAGMEPFMAKVAENYKDLPVVDTSEGLALMADGEETNPHVWLDPANAVKQTRALADALTKALPEKAEQLQANADAYTAKLEALSGEVTEALSGLSCRKMVTSHDAFDYFAAAFELEIAAVIQSDEEAEPSAQKVAEITALMTEEKIPAVFTEPDTTTEAPGVIAKEAGAKVIVLDPLTTGELDAEAYEKAMRANAAAIAEGMK